MKTRLFYLGVVLCTIALLLVILWPNGLSLFIGCAGICLIVFYFPLTKLESKDESWFLVEFLFFKNEGIILRTVAPMKDYTPSYQGAMVIFGADHTKYDHNAKNWHFSIMLRSFSNDIDEEILRDIALSHIKAKGLLRQYTGTGTNIEIR